MPLNARERRTLLIGAGVVALVLLYVFVFEPIAGWATALEDEITMKQAQLQTLRARALQQHSLMLRLQRLRAKLGATKGEQPENEPVSGFVETLEAAAKQSKVEIKGFEKLVDRSQTKATHSDWQGLRVRAECNTEALRDFLQQLQEVGPLWVTDRLQINALGKKPGWLSVDLDIYAAKPPHTLRPDKPHAAKET